MNSIGSTQSSKRPRAVWMAVVVPLIVCAVILLMAILFPLPALVDEARPTANGNLAYVTLSSSDLVALVDTTAHTVVGSVNVGAAGCDFPWQATMSPDGAHVYVGCRDSGNVAVIETAGNTVVTTVAGIPDADGIAFTRDGAYALVGSRWSNQIAVVNTATHLVINYIYTPSNARTVASHPYLDLAYATSSEGSIVVINTTTFGIITTIPVGEDPHDVAVSPDGRWVFAGSRQGDGLDVIDASSNTVHTTITGLGELTGLEVAPDGSLIFAAGLWNGVHVIDGVTFNHITTIPSVGDTWEAAVTCDGSELYVGNKGGQVPVVDTTTFSVMLWIDMPGSGARGIAICPQHVTSGVFLNPPSQTNPGARGEVVAQEETLVNATGATDSFDLMLGSHAWDTSLSTGSVGPLSNGESATFTVYVTVPTDVDWYSTDTVVVTATSVTSPTVYSDTASFTSQAYAPPQIGVSPDELTSTQYVNEIVQETLTISNGNGVTLTFELSEFDSGLSRVTACGSSSGAGLGEPGQCSAGTIAYVTLMHLNMVSLVDTSTHTEIGTVDVGSAGCYSPWRATMSPDGSHVYVGCEGSDNVAIIETAGNTVVTTVGGIDSADGIAFTRDGAYALVGSRWNSQVAVVDTATYSLTTYIYMPSNARSVAAHPYLDLAYATSGDGTIQIIDTTTFGIVASVPVGSDPHDVDVSPDGKWVFAGSRWGDGLTVIDADTNTVHTTVTGLGELTGLEVAPDGSEVYACGLSSGVHVIDGVTFNHITTVAMSGFAWQAAVTCDGGELYVGNTEVTVPVMDTATHTVIEEIPMPGGGTRGIAICPQHAGGDVLWLSIDPISGTVPTNSSVPVQVTFDATGMQPDIYSAQIVAWSNDPMTPAVFVPVAMTVEPTANMGWVEGTVTDAGTGGPLEATIIALGQPYTVTTDADTGYYILWLDEGSYTLQVSAEGYVTATADVDIVAQQGTTQDFALVRNVPVLEVSHEDMHVNQEVGETATRLMTITNAGPAPLTFELLESGAFPIQEGLVAYYPFNGNANDESGNGNDGTVEGATLTTDRFGNPDRAYSFDGLDDYIWRSYSPTTGLHPTEGPLAVSAWFKTSASSPEQQMIVSTHYAGVGDGYGTFIESSNDFRIAWFVSDIGVNIFSIDPVDDGEWHHVLGLWQDDTQYLYVDGELQSTHDTAGTLSYDNQADFRIGHSDNCCGWLDPRYYFNGSIDDVAVYNRAFSEEEVLALYNWQGGGDVPWLSIEPVSGTVPGYSSVPIQVTFDATGTQPGDYTADIIVRSNDPVMPSASVPVTMTVLPTANMGWVEGAVTDAGTGEPLEATIIAVGQPYTITTDPDTGAYTFWLDEGSYTLQVSAEGYVTATADVDIVAQQGTTQDFALVLNVPVIEVSPESLEVTHTVGHVTMRTLTIGNNGPAPLTFELIEFDTSMASAGGTDSLAGLGPADVGTTAYVTLKDSNLVSLVNTATHSEIGTVDVGAAGCYGPWRATMSPDGSNAYVGCRNSDNVAVIETAGNSVVATVEGIHYMAGGIAFTRDGAYALVGSREAEEVAVVDTATHSVVTYINTPHDTRSVAAHPFQDLAYATSGDGTIQVIDTTTFSIITSVPVGSDPHDVDVSPDGQWVFAGSRWGDGLAVIDADTNTVHTTVTGLGDLTGLEVAPDGSEVYACGLGSGIHVIDGVTFDHITTVAMPGDAWQAAVTCDGSELYVGNKGSAVPVIDTATHTVIEEIPTSGNGARGIAICPQRVGGDIPWLSEEPSSGTVPGYDSVPVEVTFDATGMEPGDYTGEIVILSNDPVTPWESVPVTMTVVEQQAALSLVPPSQEGNGLPGATVVYTLTVTNLGNYTDTFSLEASGLWTPTPSVGSTGPLGAGESFVFTLEVAIPDTAEEGSSDLATITARSEFDPGVSSSAEVTTTAHPPTGWQVYLPLVVKNSE